MVAPDGARARTARRPAPGRGKSARRFLNCVSGAMIYLRSTPSNQAIHETLARKYVPDERRALMEALPIELSRWLEPPVFDLPR